MGNMFGITPATQRPANSLASNGQQVAVKGPAIKSGTQGEEIKNNRIDQLGIEVKVDQAGRNSTSGALSEPRVNEVSSGLFPSAKAAEMANHKGGRSRKIRLKLKMKKKKRGKSVRR
jgi:hypothetical protein